MVFSSNSFSDVETNENDDAYEYPPEEINLDWDWDRKKESFSEFITRQNYLIFADVKKKK